MNELLQTKHHRRHLKHFAHQWTQFTNSAVIVELSNVRHRDMSLPYNLQLSKLNDTIDKHCILDEVMGRFCLLCFIGNDSFINAAVIIMTMHD